jgi:hypothetical protein
MDACAHEYIRIYIFIKIKQKVLSVSRLASGTLSLSFIPSRFLKLDSLSPFEKVSVGGGESDKYSYIN